MKCIYRWAVAMLLAVLWGGMPALARTVAAPADVLMRAQASMASRVQLAADALQQSKVRYGLNEDSDFLSVGSSVDQFAVTHTRFRQRYQGLRIWGGELVTHIEPGGRLREHTSSIVALPALSTTPRVSAALALAIADRDLMRKGPFSTAPRSELLIYPLGTRAIAARHANGAPVDATMVETRVHAYRLAYSLSLATRNAQDGYREMRYIVDAQTGDILDKWSEHQQAHVQAHGARSIFNGAVSINADSTPGGFDLRDMRRGAGGPYGNNVVLRYRAAGSATLLTDVDNRWGDGSNYIPGQSADDSAQSAAVDVAYGVAVTWDMYRHVFGRAGYDGQGKSLVSTVHMNYGTAEHPSGANASWSPSCECVYFGYGDSASGLKNMVDLDVVGHEFTHGVVQTTAGLIYKAEPGGLNEGLADIFGLAAKFYGRGGGYAASSSTVPAGGQWTLGENLGDPRMTRYFVTPSREAGSFDAWDSSFIDQSDRHGVHRLSGPVRRAFAFMSIGAATDGDGATPYLPDGMAGVGVHKALMMWYHGLAYYMTPLTDFAGARQALISAARDLYGATSPEEQAVWNAFRGINVGPGWSTARCGRFDVSRVLSRDQSVSSCNGQYALVMQGDGNLALYQHPGVVAWSSGTWGHPGAHATMQADGNLVVYAGGGGAALWNAGSHGSPGAALAVDNDGNLSITAPNGVPVWYLRAPSSAGSTLASSQGNTSLETADQVAVSTRGLTGSAGWNYASGYEQPAYFRFHLAPGHTIRWDFIGGALVSSRWALEVLDAAGRELASTSHTDARQFLTYTNPARAPLDVFLRIGRHNFTTIPDATTQKFSVGISTH